MIKNNKQLFRIDEALKAQIKPTVLKYKIPKEYFYSLYSFRALKKLKNANLFNRFYGKSCNLRLAKGNKSPFIDKKISNENIENVQNFETAKKKFKLTFYSNARFELKFGENIYRFIANLNSCKEDSKQFNELMDKINNANTLGRRVTYFNKKLMLT